jgi:aldehyde dehydrogenase (NAD+)
VTNQIAAPAAPSVELNARAAARAESRMLIGGRLVESSSGERFDNVSPATGEVLGSTAAATPADMDAAIASARSAFDDTGWSTDIALRRRCLLQLQEALERESEHLREELVAEAGAPLMITHIAQLDWPLADGLRYPTGLLDSYQWERELPGGGFMGEMNHRVVWKEAVGVVAAIVPWNFPFEIALNKLGQALATGNTVVLKPDPNTPWTATRIGRLIAEETEMPPGVVNVVTAAENSVAQQVVTDPRIDMISFTGSTGVGKLIAAKAADTLKRVFLELGGKSAAVMLEDGDLDAVIPNMAGACLHAGQGCVINTRLLVSRPRLDDAVNRLTEMFELLAPGDPALPDTFLGPVINRVQQDRILGYVERASAAGAEITVGGAAPRDLPESISGGTYVLPTIVAGVDTPLRSPAAKYSVRFWSCCRMKTKPTRYASPTTVNTGSREPCSQRPGNVRLPSQERFVRARCQSTAAPTTGATRHSEGTSRVGWGARTDWKASSSTWRPKPLDTCDTRVTGRLSTEISSAERMRARR